MLVLTLKEGREVRIGLSTVKVLGINGERVKLGIESPADMRIERLDAETTEQQVREGRLGP